VKIYQIEISNLCNLTCSYCPHPTQEREKGLMTLETYVKAITLVRRCGQRRVFLHNFGEPLLHPLLFDFIRHACGEGVTVSFYSNGLLLDRTTAGRLHEAGLRELCISAHVPGELGRIQALLREEGIPLTITEVFRPSKATLHTWAGQVGRKGDTGPTQPCIFEREGAAVVLWDGRVNVCCIDNEGAGVAGTVDDYLADPASYRFRPIRLCSGCELMRGDEDLS
jgi:hypothetical protein